MTPASKTPHIAASTLDLKSIFKKLAASVPVHAPVPGSGIPTNKSNATKSPLPAVVCNFSPPFSAAELTDYTWHIASDFEYLSCK